MKYISGRDWESDAEILRNTYTALNQFILEYRYIMFLQTTTLTNSKVCSSQQQEPLLFSVIDIQGILYCMKQICNPCVSDEKQLCLNITANILGSQNQISVLLGARHCIQRLKRNNPFHQAFTSDIIASNKQQHFLDQNIDPSDDILFLKFYVVLFILA